MKRQGIAINKQLAGFVPELDDLQFSDRDAARTVVDHRPIPRLQVNLQRLMLGLMTLVLVSCAPAKPPATPSPSVEATPIATPTPTIKSSVSPSPKPSTRSSRDSTAPDTPAETRTESERVDGGGSVEEPPVQKNKTIEAPREKPVRTDEKPAPAIESEAPARVPAPSDIAPEPPAPKSPKAPKVVPQGDDPEPPPAL
jgi:hypothetical protein